MARVARADLFDPAEVSVFHCINRCVRRCFLCGDEWTGCQIVRGRRGAIPAHLPPILARLGIAEQDWLPLVTGFGRHFHRVAGAPKALARLNTRRTFHPGQAALLCGA